MSGTNDKGLSPCLSYNVFFKNSSITDNNKVTIAQSAASSGSINFEPILQDPSGVYCTGLKPNTVTHDYKITYIDPSDCSPPIWFFKNSFVNLTEYEGSVDIPLSNSTVNFFSLFNGFQYTYLTKYDFETGQTTSSGTYLDPTYYPNYSTLQSLLGIDHACFLVTTYKNNGNSPSEKRQIDASNIFFNSTNLGEVINLFTTTTNN